MSTGAECFFVQDADTGLWHLKLQCWPYGESEEYDTYGPFSSYQAALDELHKHANPGGFSTHPATPEGQAEVEAVEASWR